MSGDSQIFDHYAENYDEALNQGISISGEDKNYFARGRIQFLSRILRERGVQVRTVLDFGCGTGSAIPHLIDVLKPETLLGLDTSTKSLQEATNKHPFESTKFVVIEKYSPKQEIDLAYCSSVFHHIPLERRDESVDLVYRSLRAGGLFSFWENNPVNPGTRYAMWRCPFDEDALPIRAKNARELLTKRGFRVLRTDYLFIFPRFLRHLRGIEPKVSHLPIGAQYQVLCIK